MRDHARDILELEAEFDQEEGFIGLLRSGHFDSRASDRLLSLLRRIELGSDLSVDRRLVSILWYIPLLLRWQSPRVSSADQPRLAAVENGVIRELERILGVP